MIWANLKKNKCPNCGKEFGYLNFMEPGYIACHNSMVNCTFRISEKRLSEIVRSQINSDLEKRFDREQKEAEDAII